jgi:RNA 2',3'-cyclic 3'-phosphodiesterase
VSARPDPSLRRLFLAVFPPVEVTRTVLAFSESLRRPNDGVSWVRLDNLHFTLRFMGELGESGARRAAEAAEEAAAKHAAFDAALGAAGAFPNARRARVLWIALGEGAGAMKALAGSLEEALRRRGFDRADKPFSPHLTLGRVRRPDQDWTAPLAAIAPPAGAAARFRVERLLLLESRLDPRGSIYTVLREAPLGG